jgi:hypothetical protein
VSKAALRVHEVELVVVAPWTRTAVGAGQFLQTASSLHIVKLA